MNLFQVLGGLTPEEEQDIRDEAFAMFPDIAMQEYGGINTIYTPDGRRDFHGMPVDKYTPQQLEKAMDLASSRSALREGIFRSVLESTGDLTTAADAATAAEFTPAGTVMGVQDANIAAQEIIPYLKEGDYKSAGIEAFNTALGYGDAALTALPVVGAGYKAVSKMAPTLTSDAIGLGRSVARGDLEGVRDTFTTSRDPQSLSAAVIDDEIKDFELDVGDAAFEYQPYLPTLEPKPPVGFFSPSLRAAENLKQTKGPYAQMRTELLKAGAKTDELEWSGADAAFAGKKVTKDDLITYLQENDPRPVLHRRQSGGGLTGQIVEPEQVDFDQFFDDAIRADGPFVTQLTDERVQSLVDDIQYDLIERGDAKRFDDLEDYEIMQIAEDEGHDVDEWDADDFDAFYQDLDPLYVKRGDGGWTGVDGEWEAVEEAYGRDELEEEALQSFYEYVKDEFDYDAEGTMANYGYDFRREQGSAGDFDEGDTTYAGYFPSGGDSYTENLFQFRDPTGELGVENAPYSSHFGADDETTMFTTRTADFRKADDNAVVDYTGETQSDFARRKNTPRQKILDTKQYEKKYNNLIAHRNEIMDTQGNLGRERGMAWRALENDTRALENLKLLTALDAHNTVAKSLRAGQDAQTLAKLDADGVYVINRDIQNLSPDEVSMLLKNDDINFQSMTEFLYRNPDIANDHPRYYDVNVITRDIVNADRMFNENLEAIRDLDQQTDTSFGIDTITGMRTKGTFAPTGGPYMQKSGTNQDSWAKYGIKQSILDAVARDADYVAFPYDDEAIGAVGGSHDPSQGVLDRYKKKTPKYIQDVMKPYQGHYTLEEIPLTQRGIENQYVEDDVFTSLGMKLTPELKGRINDKGFSTFAALGALPIMGVIDYMREKQENRNQRLGGLMGYGGL